MDKPVVVVLNEHSEWQVNFIEKLERANLDVHEIRLENCRFCLDSDWIRSGEKRKLSTGDIQLVVNRVSPSAKKRKNEKALFLALQVIEYFEKMDVPVINGSKAFALEISKIRQHLLLRDLKLNPPPTVRKALLPFCSGARCLSPGIPFVTWKLGNNYTPSRCPWRSLRRCWRSMRWLMAGRLYLSIRIIE